MSTTLVQYDKELWMADLGQQPQTLYKSWADFKAGTNGRVVSEPLRPFCGPRGHDTEAPFGIPGTEVMMWSEGTVNGKQVPSAIQVQPVVYKRTRKGDFVVHKKKECYNMTGQKNAWPLIKNAILKCAPDSSFDGGSPLMLGYFKGYARPSQIECDYLNRPFSYPTFPRLSFGGMQGRGLSFRDEPGDYLHVLRWVAWLNTLQLYTYEEEWLESKIVYAPHSVVLPDTKIDGASWCLKMPM